MSECAFNIREIVKEEVDKYLEEVGLKKSIRFKDDEIFLLSTEEYMKYKKVIPKVHCWWWLRSLGIISNCATSVFEDGSITVAGVSVDNDCGAVRPALKISHLKSYDLEVGDRIMVYNFPWILIDKNLAIAEVPIAFDKFDDKSNDYENSYVRKFLKNWIKERE